MDSDGALYFGIRVQYKAGVLKFQLTFLDDALDRNVQQGFGLSSRLN